VPRLGTTEVLVNCAAFCLRFARKNPQLRHREVTPAVTYGDHVLLGVTEDAMLSIRIVTAGAILAMAVSAAAAQNAATAAPGKPLPLLQILKKPATAKFNPRIRSARKTATTKLARTAPRTEPRTAANTAPKSRRFAKAAARHLRPRIAAAAARHSRSPIAPAAAIAKNSPLPIATAAAAAPANVWQQPNTLAIAEPAPAEAAPASANIWPSADPPAVADAGTAASAPAPKATDAAQPKSPSDSALSEIVVGGQTVKVEPPNQVNAIDLAADKPDAAEDVALKSDFAAASATPQAMVVGASRADDSAVGTASWIAKVLAAFGGAVAAGSAAWFMIGSSPPRITS
jgi:hypothetical protein